MDSIAAYSACLPLARGLLGSGLSVSFRGSACLGVARLRGWVENARKPVKERLPCVSAWSGGVSESNRLAALFTPPTGFEDQGRHQPCKHPRSGPAHCKARGTAGKTGFRRSRKV